MFERDLVAPENGKKRRECKTTAQGDTAKSVIRNNLKARLSLHAKSTVCTAAMHISHIAAGCAGQHFMPVPFASPKLCRSKELRA